MTQIYLMHLPKIAVFFYFLFYQSDPALPQNNIYSFDKNLKIDYAFPQPVPLGLSEPAFSNEEGDWKTDFSVPGIIGSIYSTASDNDNLYLGGNFLAAGSITANSIVRWDGKHWHSIGEGEENGIPANNPEDMTAVLAIAKADGKLYVGGQFSRAGTTDVNGIACWDGKKWNRLGDEKNNGVRTNTIIDDDTVVMAGSVYSLFVAKNKLYVGGYFHYAGNGVANGVAIWNIKDEKWETMKGGFASTDESPSVYGYSFAEYNNNIYVGGKFNLAGNLPIENIACWDGKSWHSVGEVKTPIFDIKADNKGNLYAVGYYTENDTAGYFGLGMWNGNKWKNIKGPEGYKSTISKINLLNDNLFVTGCFEKDDGTTASIARWDGKVWQVIHGLGYSNNNQLPAVIRGIEYVKGKYYIAGDFTKASDKYIVNVAVWNRENNSWNELNDGSGNKGIYDGAVVIVEKNGNDIYAGGSFSVAGGKYARNIAKWDGSEWNSLGKDTENGINGSVFAILTNDKNVFAGGYFDSAGTCEAYHVAQWDGVKWSSLGIGVGGVQGAHVRDLAILGEYLYVAGYFTTVGDEHNYDTRTNSIARFNLTSRKWEAFGKGIEYDNGIPGRIYDIEVMDDKILIGGEFNKVNGENCRNFTVLEGKKFRKPGPASDVKGLINAVEVVDDQILIGGYLQSSRQGEIFGILKWSEKGWIPLDADHLRSDNGEVFITDIEPFREGFIAGGYFNYAGTLPLNNIAYFNGNEWSDIGGGLPSGVSDIVITDNKLYLSGPAVLSTWFGNSIGVAEYDFEEITKLPDNIQINGQSLTIYPNPFSTNTRISYFVKSSSHVELSVYDSAGKKITNLLNEYKPNGQYDVSFDAKSLDPGIYVCRISYGNNSESIKMIVTGR